MVWIPLTLVASVALAAMSGPSSVPVVAPSYAHSMQSWYVDLNATGPGNGSATSPFTSVQAAIDAPTTVDGDEVLVAPGRYIERIDLRGKRLSIRATGGATETTLDGGGLGTVVTVVQGEAPGTRLEGFRIEGGTGTPIAGFACGGGVLVDGSSLQLVDCEILDCDAAIGSGVYATSASLDLEGCLLAGFVRGGGVVVEAASALTLTGCVLRDTSEDDCYAFATPICGFGALTVTRSNATISNCQFQDNRAYGSIEPNVASGATFFDCVTTIESSTFERHGNIGPVIDMGPAVVAVAGSLDVRDTLFHTNRNEARGGAVALLGVDASFGDCDFIENASTDEFWGGAVYASALRTSLLRFDRCNFRSNRGADGGAVYLGGGSAVVTNCTFEDNVALAFYYELGAGGALATADSGAHMSVMGSTFVANNAMGNGFLNPVPGEGGAVRGDIDLDHCTLYANFCTSFLPGIPPLAGASSGARLENCIVWDNRPDQLAPGNYARYSDVEGGWPGLGNIQADPRFWDPDGRDLRLTGLSPCIDAGDPAAPLDPDGSRTDMGARPHSPLDCGTPRVVCTATQSSLGCAVSLSWTGSPTLAGPDDFHLLASNVRNRSGGFLRWSLVPVQLPVGSSTLCVGSPATHVPLGRSGGNQQGYDCSGSFHHHFTQAVLSSSGLAAFDTLYAQVVSRDGAFSAGGLAVSETLRIVICPGP